MVSPATFKYAQTHPQKPKAVFDLGTAAHAKALGVGAETVAIPEKLLAINGAASTKEAKQFIADARSEGKTPLKQEVVDTVDAMCEALLAHPEAAPFFEQEGQAEMSVFATDPDTGVELRCRFDFLPNFIEEDPWHFDLKTARSAEYEAFCKATAEHGYDVQQEHYLHTYALASGDPTARMKFIVVESEPPHLVNVHELALEFTEIGAASPPNMWWSHSDTESLPD